MYRQGNSTLLSSTFSAIALLPRFRRGIRPAIHAQHISLDNCQDIIERSTCEHPCPVAPKTLNSQNSSLGNTLGQMHSDWLSLN